jgi:hypothetical protein
MTTLKLVKQTLASRNIRKKILGNNQIRKLDLSHPLSKKEEKSWQDRAGDLFNGTVGFLGWAAGGILNLGGWSAQGIWGWLVGRVEQVKAFNWNASDKELESLMKSQNLRIAAAWGNALGRSVGWIAGIAVGYGLSYLCPVIGGASLARTVATNVGRTGVEEVTNGVLGAITQTVGALANNALINFYIDIRRVFRQVPMNTLTKIYGRTTAEFIRDNWSTSKPNVSFNSKMDELVESIKNDELRTFVEAFLEESWDGFMEAGMIVAYELDSAYAQAKRANENDRGKRKTVRLTPDKRKKEQLILSGRTADLEESVIETLNNYRLISNRDVGQIVGMPAEDYLSAKPLRRQLTIVFKTKKEPPWKMPDGTQAKQREVTIPDADLGLTWAKIKLAAKPYTWGKFRATAHLDNGRQMAVYGSSKSEAEKTLRRLAELSTAKILALNVTEEVEKRNLNLKKQAMQVYPAYATLLVRRPTTGEGRNFTDGTKLEEDRIRLDLWPNEAPKGTPPLK